MSLTINKHTLMNRETIATAFGCLIGTCKAFISKEFFVACFVAFATGAAAWVGQTIAKWAWLKISNKIKSLKK